MVEIPKEDGSTRPLAISCLEDKIVQAAVARILEAIYEPTFLPCSFGFRPGTGCHDALRSLMKHSNNNPDGITIEIDLRKYFNSIPHEHMRRILETKITDKRFVHLIMKLMRSPIMANGKAEMNRLGVPQGSGLSPCLSNIYLHHVIDSWFKSISQTHMRGRAEMVRYADDMVFLFQHKEDADKFYKVLPKRLEKFGLKLHEDKSSVIQSGALAAFKAAKAGRRIPTYKFLGFTCYHGQSRNGRWRLKYKSRSDRFQAKLKGLRKHLRENLATPTDRTLKAVKRVVKGWVNYHAISDNHRRVNAFILESKRAIFSWMNRRGGKRRMNWERFSKIMVAVGYPANFRTTSMFATC